MPILVTDDLAFLWRKVLQIISEVYLQIMLFSTILSSKWNISSSFRSVIINCFFLLCRFYANSRYWLPCFSSDVWFCIFWRTLSSFWKTLLTGLRCHTKLGVLFMGRNRLEKNIRYHLWVKKPIYMRPFMGKTVKLYRMFIMRGLTLIWRLGWVDESKAKRRESSYFEFRDI